MFPAAGHARTLSEHPALRKPGSPHFVPPEQKGEAFFELQGRHGFGLAPSVTSARYLISAFEHFHWPRDFVERKTAFVTDVDTMIDIGSKLLTGETILHEREPLIFKVYYYGEQLPNRDSRVDLADDQDMFWLPKISLDWQLTELDIESARIGHDMLANEIGAAGIGRTAFNLDLNAPLPLPQIAGGHHHMGTTRMSVDPMQGVVDRDCRVHGITNLYIGGSSVFPTSGYANPTLTIVALALRLADHLREQA